MLKKILIGLALVIIALVAVAYVFPRQVHVERSMVIRASAAEIFTLVSSFSEFQKWSPWYSLDPNTKYEITGTPGEVGHRMVWSSEMREVGNGTQTIVEAKPLDLVRSELDFGDMGKAQAAFVLKPQDGGTLVTWSLDADMGNSPIGRWMGLMMDKWVGADYDKGLAKLAEVAAQAR